MPPPPRWRPLREPLVHFALGALALFAAERATSRRRAPAGEGSARIVVPRGASRAEFVREEALVREAVARGLGEGDPVVRQRLVQKLTFLLEAEASPEEPDDVALQRWLDAHAEDYRRAASVSFEQVFFSGQSRGEHAEVDARAALAGMRPDEPLTAALVRGDPHLAGPSLPARRFADVTRSFGYAFARALDDVPAGAWRGPLPSPDGWHVVRVTARDPGGSAQLSEVRADVRRRWLDERRAALVRAAIDRIVARHETSP